MLLSWGVAGGNWNKMGLELEQAGCIKMTKNELKIIDALEFRREQYGWNKRRMAFELGIGYTHYVEVLNGNRKLSLGGTKMAYKLGVPAITLLS